MLVETARVAPASTGPPMGGVLLTILGVGIAIGGFRYGMRGRAHSAARDYPRLAGLAALGLIPPVFAPSRPTLLLAVLISGICSAPIAAGQFAVIDEIAPRSQRSEALSWMTGAYGAFAAAGAAVSGQLIRLFGTQLAFAAAVAGAALAFMISALGLASLAG